MKQPTQKLNWIRIFFAAGLILSATKNQAQSCSAPLEAMTAKYWQYRDNFNKHFILNDRDPSGCVNDGIGQVGSTCEFSKAGYGLPATSIAMEPNGGFGMVDRNNETLYPQWFNQDCAEDGPDPGTSFADNAKHNYLEFGSETPHQMGWYWATLATEYELLRLNGQQEEAQRTLEELFLGLQAYRRLDMQAQCMAVKRYEEITDGFEEEACITHTQYQGDILGTCLCGDKYQGDDHKNFGTACERNCDYKPDLSGYSGFFLREDATQALEILHDPSEDKYNIDLVSSAYAMSLKPPCAEPPDAPAFSQPCYLVYKQAFMSHDGMTGLMIGLALIKRYIPENAEVTMCDGTKHKPLEMAKRITSAIVDRADDSFNNRISWPGSPGCCAKETFLSNGEGGQLMSTIHGFKHAADYIDDRDRHSNADEFSSWQGLFLVTAATKNTNAKFWLRLKALGWDMGEEPHNIKTLFHSAASTQNLEILILINNLLYPGGDNLSTNQPFLKNCSAKHPAAAPAGKSPDMQSLTPKFGRSSTAPTSLNGLGSGGKHIHTVMLTACSTAWTIWRCTTSTGCTTG